MSIQLLNDQISDGFFVTFSLQFLSFYVKKPLQRFSVDDKCYYLVKIAFGSISNFE
jgi:hypothetical protein